jgi:chorismate mutase
MSLRDLLIEAIRHGEKPEVKAFLTTVLDTALDRAHLQSLLEERVLAHDAMDASRVQRIREDMERADARRLQPHYIESFFHEAFKRLGGTAKQREPRRYEITHVPAPVRNRDRLIGIGEPGAAALRAHRLREIAGRAAGPAAGRLRLPRPPAARCRHRPHAGAQPRPAETRHRAGG